MLKCVIFCCGKKKQSSSKTIAISTIIYLLSKHDSRCKLSSCHCLRKPAFAYAKTKPQISCAVTTQLISAFVFATHIVQSLFFLNPKYQASSYLLWFYSLVCVRPGRKPRKPVFSQRGSFQDDVFWSFDFLCTTGNRMETTYNVGEQVNRGIARDRRAMTWFVR